MSTPALAVPEPTHPLDPHRVGMIAFLCSEAAFFGTLVAVYIAFIGQSPSGPQPGEVLSIPLALLGTTFLLSSSVTVHQADRQMRRGKASSFRLWWLLTISLGIGFLITTAVEWTGLIYGDGLTIGTNPFGTTFYTVVGFHALHVTVGVLLMLLMLSLECVGLMGAKSTTGVELISWYWHFVDGVWIVVFTVVYLVSMNV